MEYLKRTVIFERKDTEVAYEKIDSFIRIYLRKKGTRVFHFQALVNDWNDVEATILDILNIDSFEGCTYTDDPDSELSKFMMSLITVNEQSDLEQYLKALNSTKTAFAFSPDALSASSYISY